jgi:hypothetical protein
MYGAVFQRLNEGGAIGIFPEGAFTATICTPTSNTNTGVLSQVVLMTAQIFCLSRPVSLSWRSEL